ncbi:MAG TPA: glycosyl hydrolase [Puia sp.]|nr:glycosyl hydrolase [Puia sp.]
MKRRRFIKIASLTTASLPFLSLGGATAGNPLPTDDPLFESFANPANNHRPFVRWWWNGDRVTKEEALRELDVMKEAGIGGVEINPIKWNENADAIGIKELSWGSDEWLDTVEATVKGAKEKGMVCDMIIGSGWPFGGEFVPRSEQSKIIILGTKNLEGGQKYSLLRKELLDSISPPSNYQNKTSELFMLRLAPGKMDSFTEGTGLDDLLDKEQLDIEVPPGDHVLYYLVKVTGFQSVIQGALGANGPVINHYEQAAVQNYLDRFSDKLTARLGPLNVYFRAFFTDSIELEGANWCSDMFEQFKQRKGYDLKPYFPYMLFKVGEMGNAVKEKYGSVFSDEVLSMLGRIRYDFEETRISLFHERFIHTFTSWCKKHGVRSRMQAYGMDCHPLEASMMIDIPECETWIWTPEIEEFGEKGSGRSYTMINKFVSSAAHLAGKQLISCEEMTNTGQIFNTTLERIKVTGDQSNLSGVTHSILHGFNYSPLETPFPGWIRYGSFLNERNTWWPWFRLWSDYKARLSSVFQNSVMQADIAVLHPLADLASKYGFQRDPFPRMAYPSYVHQVWEAIHQHGNGCDYVSEHIIQQASSGNGKLSYNERRYHTLILVEVETLLPETAVAIRKFAAAGGRLIFVASTPHFSSGMQGYKKKSKGITGISLSILKKYPKTSAIVPAPGKDLLAWYREIQRQFSLTPYITISDPVYHVSQLYYKDAARDIFFFVNYSSQHSHSFKAGFAGRKAAWLWDAETGRRYLYPRTKDGELQITLGPSETRLIVFEDKVDGAPWPHTDTDGLKERSLEGPWQVTLDHVDGVSKKTRFDQLTDLQQTRDWKDFAGSILYHTVLQINDATGKTFLDLGHINDVSELEVNGQPMGARWYGNHVYDLSQVVKKGDNYISIKIITTLAAYTRSLKNNKAAKEWSRGNLYGPVGLTRPVRILSTD